MSDIKLFRFSGEDSMELVPRAAQMERGLQKLMEKHLENFLGIRLVAHEFGLGRQQRGKIDSLGLDENNCPVIIEYKRYNDENIICQGLYYLNWLLEHRADFAERARSALGDEAANAIEFDGSRILCIASSFSRYDEDAILQIDRNIELIRYRFFGEDMLLLEFLNTPMARFFGGDEDGEGGLPARGVGMPAALQARMRGMNGDVAALYHELMEFAQNLGDDVSIRFLKHYVALGRYRNFTCIQPARTFLKIWLNLDPAALPADDDFCRDMSAIGHVGTGNVEVDVRDAESLARLQPLMERAYREN